MLSAKAAGAEPIIITDVIQSRLDFAKALHPSVRTVLVQPGKSPHEVAVHIREAAEGPVKIVFECTGVQSSIHAGIYVRVCGYLDVLHTDSISDQSAQSGGKVLVIGLGRDEQIVSVVLCAATVH